MELLETVYLGNSLRAWLTALGVGAGTFGALMVVRSVIVRKVRGSPPRPRADRDDLGAHLIRRTRLFFLFFLALAAGSTVIAFPPELGKVEWVGHAGVKLAFLVQAAIWGNGLILGLLARYQRRHSEDPASISAVSSLGFIGRLVFYSILLLTGLRSVGVDITGLAAALGVGGIAVALAAQNILGDLFSSLSIVLDKPFVVGDLIYVGEYAGTVEHVGLKTTRVRSLSGEQIVFSNADLLGSRIRNYGRMKERQGVFTIGVTYQTPFEKLAAIPGIIGGIIRQEPLARLDRCHFKAYGDFALNFETVYYVQVPDYNTYMDIQQKINLELFRRFQKEGIEFAYPTQTIFAIPEKHPGSA
jgi:small-conductance mechanosensitive channel